MTTEEMNRAIAVELGWKFQDCGEAWRVTKPNFPKELNGFIRLKEEGLSKIIPNYCADKNSHESIFALIEEKGLRTHFNRTMERVANSGEYADTFCLLSAPAPLIVEAALKALAKWEEGTE